MLDIVDIFGGDTVNHMKAGLDNVSEFLGSIGLGEVGAFINHMLPLPIDLYCDFGMKMRYFLERAMHLNLHEKAEFYMLMGLNANDESNGFDVKEIEFPEYAHPINYLDHFAIPVTSDENFGVNATNTKVYNDDPVYGETLELYPDDLGVGKFDNKQYAPNNASILNKTKKLFNQFKIHSTISRFGTGADGNNGGVSKNDAQTVYGMSHGRNLLKKGAERDGERYDVNGYNNPYCRVWTHHYQYDNYSKLIRPFVDEEGVVSNVDLNTWNDQFRDNGNKFKEITDNEGNVVGQIKIRPNFWREDPLSRRKSVLDNQTGILRIAPKYRRGGGAANIHPKSCMFSIENLAWKDYDPYSFENALSWEQRGPLGGRIMWFPPYGLKFNENVNTQWKNNTFIGRGEDVYTYSNTVRSGTLSFMLVVDHPSITDYATWYNSSDYIVGGKDELTDTDWLRYFAGCDFNEVVLRAKPTPLTDEYTIESQETVKPNLVPEPKKEIPPIEIPEPDIDETVEIYAFYPNNYSGCYDSVEKNGIEPLAYLMFGVNAQKSGVKTNNGGQDVRCTFEDFEMGSGHGYEQTFGNRGITNPTKKDNYIIGTTFNWNYPNGKKDYVYVNEKKWYYRIDGEYSVPKTDTEKLRNTYCQTLKTVNSYKDLTSFALNSDKESFKELVSNEDGEKIILSLYDAVCYANKHVGKYKKLQESIYDIVDNGSGGFKSDIAKFEELLDNEKVELVSMEANGYANNHGSNSNEDINLNRNNLLAKQRAETLLKFFKDLFKEKYKDSEFSTTIGETNVENITSKDENSKEAKLYRSAKLTLRFKTKKVEKASDVENEKPQDNNQQQTTVQTFDKYVGFVKFEKEGGEENVNYYKQVKTEGEGENIIYLRDDNGNYKLEDRIWRELPNGELVWDEVVVNGQFKNWDAKHSSINNGKVFYDKSEKNIFRYDQEYHFFKELNENSPALFKKLTEKLKYFDPAFHSMTPEGFNGRLTFLQQCMRQGDTISKSDSRSGTANNMAFGRPPFCVLRIGDFYNQMIVIDSMNIDYSVSEGIQWDLNPEGAGVQPMLAEVTLNFKFIGGGDLGGPIRRLQNAMSFNYYANARLYDNRADRVEYENSVKTVGGAGNNKISDDASYYHSVAKYTPLK